MNSTALDSGQQVPLRAVQACLSCRKQKRKCDKILPACGLCQRMDRPCDYSDNSPPPNAGDFALLRQKVADLESRLDEKAASGKNGPITPESLSPEATLSFGACPSNPSAFPAAFFLDAEVYRDARWSIPRPSVSIASTIFAALGTMDDIQASAETFFSTVQLWLPIISKKRLQLTLSNPHLEPTADLALLLLTMKLVTQSVSRGSSSAYTALYYMSRNFYNLLESSALMSLQLLQSLILIGAYEIGHGMYPAAYLTTGQCSRLGYALGLHRRKSAPQMIKRPGAWAEVEEMNRAWWAVMLLDRYVNLGGNDRPLATEDPLRSQMLPANEESWDNGQLTTTEPLYVSTPTSVKAGNFARTAQTTHLLGRLVRLLNDQSDDLVMRFTEAAQIHRTITALTNLLVDEVENEPLKFGTPAALCYTALLHLCDGFACTESNRGQHTVEETEMQGIAIAGLRKTSADALRLSQLLKLTMSTNLSATSPLTADCLYQAAAQYAWLVHETGEKEMVSSYHALGEVLVLMNRRWSVAGEYIKILEAARESLYENNPYLALNV